MQRGRIARATSAINSECGQANLDASTSELSLFLRQLLGLGIIANGKEEGEIALE